MKKFCEKSNIDSTSCSCILILYPNTPCMEYLPTFGLNLWYMWVNMPYMEHVGY